MRGDDILTEYPGFLLGVALTIAFFLIAAHIDESHCQTEFDVADCTWISVPVLHEGESP